jgi:hypothetical protein
MRYLLVVLLILSFCIPCSALSKRDVRTLFTDTFVFTLLGASSVAIWNVLQEAPVDSNGDPLEPADWRKTMSYGIGVGAGVGLVFGVFDIFLADDDRYSMIEFKNNEFSLHCPRIKYSKGEIKAEILRCYLKS